MGLTLQLPKVHESGMGQARKVLASVKEFEFEGIVAKRLDSIYLSGYASNKWQKQKTQRSDDLLSAVTFRGDTALKNL